MNRRRALRSGLVLAAAPLLLAACRQSDEDCDADDLLEGDEDCDTDSGRKKKKKRR